MANDVVESSASALITAALRLLADDLPISDNDPAFLLRNAASFIERQFIEIHSLKEQLASKSPNDEQLNGVKFDAVLKAINYCELPKPYDELTTLKVVTAINSYARSQWGPKQ